MKVISLIQPWASLIAWEEKFVETRSRKTKHRGPIGIHASKKIDLEACHTPEIKKALLRHGITDPKQLPTGCILATANMFDCAEMVQDDNPHGCKIKGYKISEKEYAFGYYEPGRFGYMLSLIKALKTPIPAKGQLGLWEHGGNL
jgi:hypothetical protein